jgi:hypothetical protein
VVDLLAREGVHVNGERVRWAWLADGDALQIGRFTFVLRYEIAPDRITRQDVPLEAGASLPELPGTELAISARHSEPIQGDLVAHSRPRTRVPLRVVGAPPRVEPAALAPAEHEGWEPPVPFPPSSFAMWRQQMELMESFHHDMILMVQMFVAMHREHAASVRHELDMVQQLTQELSALQAKSEQSPESESAPSTAAGERRSAHPKRSQDRARVRLEGKSLKSGLNVRGHEARPASHESGARSKDPASKVPPAGTEITPGPGADHAVEGEQIHAQLTERIAKLQRERQGYWQRILSTINR